MAFFTHRSRLPAALLLLLAPRLGAAAQVDCAATRTTWSVASDGKALDASLFDVNWVGAFNSKRSTGTYVGTDQNLITKDIFVQRATVTSFNGNTVYLPTTLFYCPLNITAASTTIGGAPVTRYDIWWVVTMDTGGLPDASILRVQCLSLARLPDANGVKNLESWQTEASTCPSVTPCTAAAPCTSATYTAPLVAAASGASALGAATSAAAVVAVAGAALLL